MTKTYSMKSNSVKLYIVLGGILLASSIALIFLIGRVNAPVIASSSVLLLLGFWYKDRALITFSDSQFEMKVAFVGPRHLIRYSDFIRLDVISNKKASLYYRKDGKERRLALPMTFLSEFDQDDLIYTIQAKLEKEPANSIFV